MRDFTFKVYKKLLESIKESGYSFQTFEDFNKNPKDKVVVLRHDSDIWPENDLKIAKIEKAMDIVASYYFRIPETFRVKIVEKIKGMNHEIGYHYEDLARHNGDYERAITNFALNLEKLRKHYPVKTCVMHGRPLSKWDSKLLWERYNLKDYNIIAEPYLSINYKKVLYLTDNGSRWDANKSNIRDKVNSGYDLKIKTTFELVEHFRNIDLPDQIILNVHPARWNDIYIVWLYRFILQKVKNVAKFFLNKLRN